MKILIGKFGFYMSLGLSLYYRYDLGIFKNRNLCKNWFLVSIVLGDFGVRICKIILESCFYNVARIFVRYIYMVVNFY